MMKLKRPIVYIIIALLLPLFIPVIRGLVIDGNTVIDKQTAIEKAQLYCEQTHSTPQKTPHNINAKLLACNEVKKQTGLDACDTRFNFPNLKVWFVSMNGLWFYQGPPHIAGDSVGRTI